MNLHRYFLIDETDRKLCAGPKDYHEALTAEEVVRAGKTAGHDYCAYLCPKTVQINEEGHLVDNYDNLEQFDRFLQNRDRNAAVYIIRNEPDGLKVKKPDWFKREANDKTEDGYPEPSAFSKRLQKGYIIYYDNWDRDLSEDGIGPFYSPKEAEEAFENMMDDPRKNHEDAVEDMVHDLAGGTWPDARDCEYILASCSDVLAGDDMWGSMPYLNSAAVLDINHPKVMMTGQYTVYVIRDEDGEAIDDDVDFSDCEYSPYFLKDLQEEEKQTAGQEHLHGLETEVADYHEEQDRKTQKYAERLGLKLSSSQWEDLVIQSLRAANRQNQNISYQERQDFIDGTDEYAIVRMKRGAVPDWIPREDSELVYEHVVDTAPDLASGLGKLFVTANTSTGSDEWVTPEKREHKIHDYYLISRHGLSGIKTLRYLANIQVTESNPSGRVVFVERGGLRLFKEKLTPEEKQALESISLNPELFQPKVSQYPKAEIDSRRVKAEQERIAKQEQKEVNRK